MNSTGHIGNDDIYNDAYTKQQALGWSSSKAKCLLTLGNTHLITITLLVLGALAAAGVLSATTVGCAAIGLGAGSFILEIANGNLKKRKVQLIIATLAMAATITLGALGYVGMLSSFQVGIAIIGTQAATWPLFLGVSCSKLRQARTWSNVGGSTPY